MSVHSLDNGHEYHGSCDTYTLLFGWMILVLLPSCSSGSYIFVYASLGSRVIGT